MKRGDIRASSATRDLTELVGQLRVAYDTPFEDPTTGRSHRMSGVYAITPGKVSDYSRRYLREHTGQWLHVIDGDQLEIARDLAVRPAIEDRRARAALLNVDLMLRIKPAADETARNLASALADPEQSQIGLRPAVCPTRATSRFIEACITEIHTDDLLELLTFETHVYGFNSLWERLPLGSINFGASRPTFECLEKIAKALSQHSCRAEEIVNHYLAVGAPAPGERLERAPGRAPSTTS